MKITFLLFFFLHLLWARENPFEPIYCVPKVHDDIIPLLHITTNKVFAPPAKIELPATVLVEKEKNTTIESTIPTKEISIVSEETNSTNTIKNKITKQTIKIEKKLRKINKKKTITKKRKYKTIYQNYFLKVQTNYKNFKIFTNDKLLKKVRYTHPERMTFDFDRLQYFHTKNITLNKAFARKIKFGSHHDFYRITIELGKYKQYKLTKKPYGYLLSFY